jgi:hypothetical protein
VQSSFSFFSNAEIKIVSFFGFANNGWFPKNWKHHCVAILDIFYDSFQNSILQLHLLHYSKRKLKSIQFHGFSNFEEYLESEFKLIINSQNLLWILILCKNKLKQPTSIAVNAPTVIIIGPISWNIGDGFWRKYVDSILRIHTRNLDLLLATWYLQ